MSNSLADQQNPPATPTRETTTRTSANHNNNNVTTSTVIAAPPTTTTGRTPEEAAMLGVLAKRISVDAANNVSVSQIVDAKYQKVQARRLLASTFPAWRRTIHEFVFQTPWFNRIIFFFVFLNAMLVLFDADGRDEGSAFSIPLFIVLDMIAWFFLIEVLVMMLASGVLVRRIGFFSSKTNVINLLLTILALYDFFQRRAWSQDDNRFAIVAVIARVTRLLRSFRTLAEIPSVRQLFDALQKSVSRLIDVLFLFVAFALIIGLVGMQFFEKSLKYRCATPSWVNCTFVEGDEVPCTNVPLADEIAQFSPVLDPNITTDLFFDPATNLSLPRSVKFDPRQASFVIDDNMVCQPPISYTEYFDVPQAWYAVMLRQLSGSDFALWTSISLPLKFFTDFHNPTTTTVLPSSSTTATTTMTVTSTSINNNTNTNSPSSNSFVGALDRDLTMITRQFFVNESILPFLKMNSSMYQISSIQDSNNWNTVFHGRTCPYSQACVPYMNPQHGFTSFDTVFPAFITMYFVTFLEGWSTIAMLVMDARGSAAVYFFCFLVLAGALFMLNLVLAILVDAFTRSLGAIRARDATLKEEQLKQIQMDKKKDEEQRQLKRQQKLLSAQPQNQTNNNNSSIANNTSLNTSQQSPALMLLGNPTNKDRDDNSSPILGIGAGPSSGGGLGLGGFHFRDDDSNNTNNNNNSMVDSSSSLLFSPPNRELSGTVGPTSPFASTSANPIKTASRVLGFVRKARSQQQQPQNDQEMQTKSQEQEKVKNQDEEEQKKQQRLKDLDDLLGRPIPKKEVPQKEETKQTTTTTTLDENPALSNSQNSGSKSNSSKSKKVDPNAPPVLGFRRKQKSENTNQDEEARKVLFSEHNNNKNINEELQKKHDPSQKKKLMDLFEGDDPKRQAALPYVGIVLSTTLAISGGKVSAQHVAEQGCWKVFKTKAKFYGRLIRFVVRSKIVTKTWFHVASAFLTFVNVVLLASVFHGMPAEAEVGLFYATSTIALLFSIEIILKLIALPFVRLMRDVMNIVDLIVTIMALVEFFVKQSTTVTAIRCIRILRLLSVVDSLRETVKVLKKGLVATIPIIIFLIIFLYFYAVVGMVLFSGKLCVSSEPTMFSSPMEMFLQSRSSICESQKTSLVDPRTVATAYNFDNFGNALLATFVVFIGDNWAGMMAFAMERTNILVCIWHLSCFTIAGFIIVNLFIAAMIEACSSAERTNQKEGDGRGNDNNNNNDGLLDYSDVQSKGALFGNEGGGPFKHRASMFLQSGQTTPAKKKNINNKKKSLKDAKNKKSSSSTSKSGSPNNNNKGGGEKQSGDKSDNDNDDNDHNDDEDENDTGAQLLLRFKTITNLAASFRKRSNSRHSGKGSEVSGDGLETTVFLGSPGSPDLRNFSALASPARQQQHQASGQQKRARGSSGVTGRLQRGSNYRPVVIPGENDDDFDMILDDMYGNGDPSSPRSAYTGSNGPNSNDALHRQDTSLMHCDSDLKVAFLRRGNSDLGSSVGDEFGSINNRGRNVLLEDDEKELTTAAARNAQQRSKMTGAQRLQRLARRALYGEKAFSAAQREEDKFGKIMLAASRILGVEVNELSDFDRALLLPYFDEIRKARKFEEAKHVFRRYVGYMTRHPLYRVMSVIWVIFNTVTYILMADSFRPPDHPQQVFFAYSELLNAIVMNLDICFCIVSIGVYTREATRVTAGFFNYRLNIAKFVVGLLCIGATISSFVGTTDSTNGLRIFSRVLPIWLYIPQHQPTMLILISVFDALVSLGNVGFIAVLVWITYSIMGTQLFRGTFYACGSTENEDNWGDQTYTGARIYNRTACLNQSYYWVSYPRNFNNVWESMETLFGVSTTDDWSTIAFISMSAKSHDEAPDPGSNMGMAIFCCSFILVAALFLLNVFIAVLVNAYFETQQRMERNIRHSLLLGEAGDLLDPAQRDFYDLYRRALCYVKKPPSIKFAKGTVRWWIRRVSRANIFQLGILLLAFVNIIVQFTAFTAAPPPAENLLIVDIVFTSVLFVMISMKILGSGLTALLRENYWSIIEIIVVLLNLCCTIAAIVFTFAPPTRFSPLELENNLDLLGFLRQSRILLLHRVMSATPGARVLVDTIARSSQTLMSAILLLLLLFLSYSSLGLVLFGRIFGRDKYTNFWTIPRALYTLLCVATSNGWQPIMSASGARPPNCDPQIGDCGIAGVSPLFFMSFIILGQWVGISLFVAILVESFSRSERQERLRVQHEDVKRFRRMWKKHCRANMMDSGDDATAATPMPITQLPLFLMELGAPLGPVSSRMVFVDTSRQTQLPEFPELKFAWALQAEQKQKADLAKQQKQMEKLNAANANWSHQQLMSQSPSANASATIGRESSANGPQTPNSKSADGAKNAAASLFELPSLSELWSSFTRKFQTMKTQATGTAIAMTGSDGSSPLSPIDNNSVANNTSFAQQQQKQQPQIKANAVEERFATRSDAEKLLAKLSLPTFVCPNGKRCVAQYSLFDALIRYYYGCSLPPRTDLELHEFLLNSFGVSREESTSQIAKPSQRISSNNEPTLVVKRERGVSGSRNLRTFSVIPLPKDDTNVSRRNLLGGKDDSSPQDPSKDLQQPSLPGGDDGRSAVSQSGLLKRKQSSGFVEILADGDQMSSSRFRSRSQMTIDDVFSIDQISVGAMFSIVKIQAIWRGARIRNKISRLAELAALGLPEISEDNLDYDENGNTIILRKNNKHNNRNQNDDDDQEQQKQKQNRSSSSSSSQNDDDNVEALDATMTQAALTLRNNPKADLFAIVAPEQASSEDEEANKIANKKPDDGTGQQQNVQQQHQSGDINGDGGEAEGRPPGSTPTRKRRLVPTTSNQQQQQQHEPTDTTGGVRTLMAVAKLAGIIERNRRRTGKTEIRHSNNQNQNQQRQSEQQQQQQQQKDTLGVKAGATAMKAAGRFTAALKRQQKQDADRANYNNNNRKPSAVALQNVLSDISPRNNTDDVSKPNSTDVFGKTYEEVSGSDSSFDDDENQQAQLLADQMRQVLDHTTKTTSKSKNNNNSNSSPSSSSSAVAGNAYDFLL